MGFHGTDFFAGDRRFYGAVDAAFAVSPRVAELAEEHVGSRPALIPNPVDVDFFSPATGPGAPREGYFEGTAAMSRGVTMTDEEKQEFYRVHDTFWVPEP